MAHLSNRFSLYIFIGRLVTMAASFAMPLILVRCMSQSDYGVFSQYFMLYTAVYVIIGLGQHSNLFFFYPSASDDERSKLVLNTFITLLIFGVIGSIIMYCPLIANMIFGDSVLGQYKEWILLSIALATPMNIVSPLNIVRADKWGAMLIPGFVAVTRIITVIACTLLFNDLETLFKWLFFFQVFILLVVGGYSVRDLKLRIDIPLLKKQLAYSLPFGFAVALQLFSNYYDKFVSIKFLDPADYAIYAVAFLSIPGVSQVYDSLCQVNIVNMSKSFRDGKVEDIAPQYGNFVLKTLSFSTPLIFAVSLFSEEIMSFLYTDSYVSAAPYFRLYSLTFITSMLGAGTILRSMGKTKQSLMAFVATCVVGLPLTYFLVSQFGTNGAIIGAVVNMMFPRVIQLIIEARSLNLSISEFLPWKDITLILTIALVLLLPFAILKYAFMQNIVVCIIECSIYVLAVYALYVRKNIFIINSTQVMSVFNKLFKNKNGKI